MKLASSTTEAFRGLLEAARPVVALVPVGSTEPHGPHLPLATDVVISEAACERAVPLLEARGHAVVIAPAVAYGVTECAAGFAGAVSVPAAALTAYLRAIVESLLGGGARHVCLVNNHLEPAHDRAVRDAVTGLAASVACPLTRKWARTLSAEFKSGACHAGRYETSIVMAAQPGAVDESVRGNLPEVPISLSEQLAKGVGTFAAMGMERAYAGAPAAASAAEGEEQLARLAEMIVGEVCEGIGG